MHFCLFSAWVFEIVQDANKKAFFANVCDNKSQPRTQVLCVYTLIQCMSCLEHVHRVRMQGFKVLLQLLYSNSQGPGIPGPERAFTV